MTIEDDRPVYCWDSDVILAWFKAEQDKPLADMRQVVDEIEKGKARLLLSVVTLTEFLELPESREAAANFRKFTKRSDVQLENVTPRVAEKAAEIRLKGQGDGRSIKTPDALIIATAIVSFADVLHSFDLTGLDRLQIVNGLHICRPKPLSGQKGLPE